MPRDLDPTWSNEMSLHRDGPAAPSKSSKPIAPLAGTHIARTPSILRDFGHGDDDAP
jgi:hypothetical protein